jgi:predicted Zn-dependent protease
MKKISANFRPALKPIKGRAIQSNSGLRRVFGPFVLGAALSLSACQSVNTTSGGTVGIDRQQRMSSMVSESSLRESAVKAYAQTLGEEKQKGALNADPAMTQRVRNIAARIIPTTAAFRAEAPKWAWEVNVIKSDQLNAWCMPGGKIAFYSGIIEKLQLTDDEIGAIMGHEIAHALREHARERASEQMGAQAGLLILGAATGSKAITEMVGAAYNVSFGLPHSRTHETEADRMGVELSARAGFDPRAAVSVWQKMAKIGGGKGPEFLSTHPSAESRIKDLEDYSARVQPLYEQSKRK